MAMDRRDFLKLGGLAAAGVAGAATVIESVLGRGAVASTAPEQEAVASAVRWGMVIDVKKLTTAEAYQRCIDACHSIHNVPDMGNKKDEIKWIWRTPFENAFPSKSHQYVSQEIHDQDFLVFCNHCKNPPCVRVCPTQATFKRPQDGIVMMDYHRCIGCRFCMAGCPYGARSFNWRNPRPFIEKVNKDFPTRERGVVEKCNFCAERLAVDKQPACVEAARGALVFGDLSDEHSEIRQVLRRNTTIQRKPEAGTNPSLFYIV
jgi:molybdopterin-containing oxidoreductase family iron-sulfur binding subunit